MGTGLAGHPDAALLGLAYEFHALSRGNVADVVAASCLRGEFQVAGDLAPFALGADAPMAVLSAVAPVVDVAAAQQRVVLAVRCEDHVLARGGLHRPPHHFLALDSAAVVREGYALVFQCIEIYEFQALAALGDGAVGEDADHGVAVDCGLLDGQGLRAVGHGIQVGHRANQRVAAPCGGQTAAADGFLPGLTRLAEMYVKVGKGRQRHHIIGQKKDNP